MIESFGIINILRNYCSTNNIYFIPGNNAYVNAVADQHVYADNELILIADFNSSPTFNGGRIVGNTYSGLLALGRKVDVDNLLMDSDNNYVLDVDNDYVETADSGTTVSTLDETYEQKYDRRLRFLSNKLAEIIGDIVCENEYEVSSVTFKLQLNTFDINADFVAATITLTE